jgi:hypothetical protein
LTGGATAAYLPFMTPNPSNSGTSTDEQLTTRALAAWFKSGTDEQPYNSSGVRAVRGKDYVVLRNERGVLAVYRVRTDGRLKGLKRWPAVFDEGESGPRTSMAR